MFIILNKGVAKIGGGIVMLRKKIYNCFIWKRLATIVFAVHIDSIYRFCKIVVVKTIKKNETNVFGK